MKITKEGVELDFDQLSVNTKYICVKSDQDQYLNHVVEKIECEWRRDKDTKFLFSHTPQKSWVRLLSKDWCIKANMRFVEQGKEGYICELNREELKEICDSVASHSQNLLGTKLYDEMKKVLNG